MTRTEPAAQAQNLLDQASRDLAACDPTTIEQAIAWAAAAGTVAQGYLTLALTQPPALPAVPVRSVQEARPAPADTRSTRQIVEEMRQDLLAQAAAGRHRQPTGQFAQVPAAPPEWDQWRPLSA